MGRAAYAGYLIRFTLDEKLILPEYFDTIAKSDIFEAFKISMKRIGAKPNINSREYGIFRFPMPLNLDEQKGIAKLFTKVDEATASYKKAVADYEQTKQNVYLDVKSAYINLMNSQDSIQVSKLALQQAKEQQYQAFRRYQVGLGDAIEFKDSENTYLNAQLDYYSVLLEYNKNAAEIERVIGAPIVESDIEL
jgi:CHASE2 domain-containing sensor protein